MPQTTFCQLDLSSSDLLSGGLLDVSKLHSIAPLGNSIDHLVLKIMRENSVSSLEMALRSLR